jgi:4-aminobutyrate aminotransferase/(S)-3-amino-2-methylpropionate transaminase
MAPTIDLRTELPGPRSTEILARKQRVIADAKSIYLPLVIDHAHGVAVTDVDGNTFLDWTGGIGCLNVGHTNEAVSAALHAQIDRFLHTDFTMVPYESYIELAERLLEKTPIAGPKKAAFFNSGAEAVENAVKIAKLATGRPAVIATRRRSGRTHMAMSLTPGAPVKAGFGIRVGSTGCSSRTATRSAPTPPRSRWPTCGAPETRVAPESVAASSSSPSGEGGSSRQRRTCGAARICDEHGIVFDRRQCSPATATAGCSRWSTSASSPTSSPSQSIAGVPISGVLGRSWTRRSTRRSAAFVGNLLGCEAAIAVLDDRRRGLLARGTAIGKPASRAYEEPGPTPRVGDVAGSARWRQVRPRGDGSRRRLSRAHRRRSLRLIC